MSQLQNYVNVGLLSQCTDMIQLNRLKQHLHAYSLKILPLLKSPTFAFLQLCVKPLHVLLQ